MAEEKKLPPTELQLTNLDTRNDFAEKYSNLSPAQQRNKYKELWLKHTAAEREKAGTKSLPKKVHSKLWDSFKKIHGELLAPELDTKGNIKPDAWSTEPIFKVRFTEAGNLSTAAAVNSQMRKDGIDLLTKATPGTELPFKKTSKRFLNPTNWQADEIHHFDPQASYEPYYRETLRKIRSSDPDIQKQGQLEFAAAAREGYRSGAILGDKVESYMAQPPIRHRNTQGEEFTSHGLSGNRGINYTTTTSGGSALGLEENRGGRSGSLPQLDPAISTRQRLDRMPRTGDGYTVWSAAFGENKPKEGRIGFYAMTHDANVENANLATIFGKEDPRIKKDQPFVKKHPGTDLRAEIGDEAFDTIAKGNKKGIAKTLLKTVKDKGRFRDILNTLGVSWNPAVNVTADILGAVWDGVAYGLDPSVENAVDFGVSSGIVGSNLAALGLSLVPVPGARVGAYLVMRGADTAQVAKAVKGGTKLVEGGVKNLKNIQRGLEVAEQTINRSREGIEISTNKKVQKAVQDSMRALIDSETKENSWTGRNQKVRETLRKNRQTITEARRASRLNRQTKKMNQSNQTLIKMKASRIRRGG